MAIVRARQQVGGRHHRLEQRERPHALEPGQQGSRLLRQRPGSKRCHGAARGGSGPVEHDVVAAPRPAAADWPRPPRAGCRADALQQAGGQLARCADRRRLRHGARVGRWRRRGRLVHGVGRQADELLRAFELLVFLRQRPRLRGRARCPRPTPDRCRSWRRAVRPRRRRARRRRAAAPSWPRP